MNKLFSVMSVAVVVGVMASAPASAWWGGGPWGNNGSGGGPWNAMSDAFGGGDVNFNANPTARVMVLATAILTPAIRATARAMATAAIRVATAAIRVVTAAAIRVLMALPTVLVL